MIQLVHEKVQKEKDLGGKRKKRHRKNKTIRLKREDCAVITEAAEIKRMFEKSRSQIQATNNTRSKVQEQIVKCDTHCWPFILGC